MTSYVASIPGSHIAETERHLEECRNRVLASRLAEMSARYRHLGSAGEDQSKKARFSRTAPAASTGTAIALVCVMSHTHRQSRLHAALEPALGWLGLLLIALLGWAVERLHTNRLSDAITARFALAFVAATGWIIDRLPLGGQHTPNEADMPASVENASTLTFSSRHELRK
jgi:hypothetical protein